MFELSDRIKATGFSEIVKIRNQILEMRAKGIKIYQFEGGEPFPATPDYIKEACWEAIKENKTRYAPSSGIPELIEAIKNKVNQYNKIPAANDDIIVTNGGMQGLFGAFQSILNEGDEVLVFSPYWTPIKDFISLSGGRLNLVNIWLAKQEGITNLLKQKYTAKTKAVYVNSPQNPTGCVFSKEELEEIAKFAEEKNLIIISDESYEHIIYETEHISIASFPNIFRRTITVFSLSKSYAMTGWRIGYTVAPEPFISGLKKIVLNSSNGVNTPTQYAALKALTHSSGFIENNLSEYKKRRDLLVNGLNSLGFECEMPGGAFYAFPRIKKYDNDSWRFSRRLLEEAHVATVPGLVFGPDGEGHLRFSFSTSIENIQEGLQSLKRIL